MFVVQKVVKGGDMQTAPEFMIAKVAKGDLGDNEREILRTINSGRTDTDNRGVVRLVDEYKPDPKGDTWWLILPILKEINFAAAKAEDFRDIYIPGLLNGVAFLHNMRIAHRDIKPEHLLYDPIANQTCIIDFDCAWLQKGPAICYKRVGTGAYMAPEIFALGSKKQLGYDPFAADRYSCGRVLEDFAEYLKERLSTHSKVSVLSSAPSFEAQYYGGTDWPSLRYQFDHPRSDVEIFCFATWVEAVATLLTQHNPTDRPGLERFRYNPARLSVPGVEFERPRSADSFSSESDSAYASTPGDRDVDPTPYMAGKDEAPRKVITHESAALARYGLVA